jgi:DNA-binding CsgD family transcriptional regulator
MSVHHPGITRGRVNLALPARRGGPRARPPGGSAIDTDNGVSVQSQLIAVPRPTGPRVQRAALLHSLPADPDLKPYVDELSIRAEAAAVSSNGPARQPPGGVLSDRELTVLRLLASRLTTTEIAGALFVSPNTLKSHMKSIYRKLDVNSRADAVREGQAHGPLI